MWLNNTIQEHDTGAAAKPNKRWDTTLRLQVLWADRCTRPFSKRRTS